MNVQDKKRLTLVVVAIIAIFIIGLMLKFWLYTIVILISFGAGYVIGDRKDDNKTGDYF
jgi:hypothetical protein